MRRWYKAYGLFTIACIACSATIFADNPIFQTVYTADPAPMVFNDTLYCYTSHDEDVTEGGFFTMKNWCLFSTTDMVNWRSHGRVASLKNFSWAGTNGAWAVQCIPRDGKFYMYCPIHMKGIGVLVADKPDGPFTDPVKKALLTNTNNDIDPSVFIDSDEQAYLYWGNPTCTYAKLNADMISLSGTRTALPMTVESFGKRSNTDRATSYEEGPWIYKRGSTYYLGFAGGPISEHLAYSTSTGPTGPWKYGGVIMSTFSGGAFTNHPGIAEYKGNSYIFYHGQQLSNNGYKRSVCVDKLTYDAAGAIAKVTPTKEGPAQLGALDPYATVQAETICYEQGVETNPSTGSEGGIMVDSINNNDYIKLKGVDFGDGAKSFEARVASGGSGGKIELRLDSQTGKLIGTCDVPSTGGWDKWATQTCTVSDATGKHDLYLKFTGGSGFLFNFNWWKFTPIKTSVMVPDDRNRLTGNYIRVSVTGKKAAIRLHESLPETRPVTIALYDVAGRLAMPLITRTAQQPELSLSLKTLPAGTYLMKVMSGYSKLTETIIIE
jgi:hypothetical protein